MTPKIISKDKSSSDLLQTIDPKGIATASFTYAAKLLTSLTVGRSALVGDRKKLPATVTTATVFPSISKNSTL